MSEELDSLLRREQEAWVTKSLWDALYDEAASLALPQRNTFGMKNEPPGQGKNTEVYDSALQQATVKLAGTLQATITPPFTAWAKLIPGPYVLTNRRETAKNLQNISDAVFAAMQVSTFDMAVGEFFLDLLLGTGIMLVLEGSDENVLKFNTIPISEIALEEGPDNTIGAVFRRFVKPARTLKPMWKDFEFFPELEKLIEEKPQGLIKLSEVTFKDGNKFRYQVIVNNIDSVSKVCVDRLYTSNPWIIARWLKTSGEVFGRGPILNALPDAKTSNKVKELELKNASLAILGVWMAKNNGFVNPNSLQILPGAVIPVQATGGQWGADIDKLPVGGSLEYSQIIQQDLQQSIKNALYDRSMPDKGGVRSATEWIIRNQQLQEDIGAPFGRLHQEFVRPLFKRILDIFYRKGIIPNRIPLDGGWEDVKITGTLAQAQNLKEVEAISNWGSMCTSLIGPELFAGTAKVENLVSKVGDYLGISGDLIRSEEEKQQLAEVVANAGSPEG